MKPGYKTTEFWLSFAGVVATSVAAIVGALPLAGAAGTAAAIVGTYNVARSIVKAAHAKESK